ncbi:hypothetical protein ACSYDW_14605 [Paeniglutamicibacter sp. R2-26]|uniref:hypothetical protein n=1 Tax=Paeniglutamicibacter sp. R2-26 TaxID=3144417 RepID=UPI003EE68E51
MKKFIALCIVVGIVSAALANLLFVRPSEGVDPAQAGEPGCARELWSYDCDARDLYRQVAIFTENGGEVVVRAGLHAVVEATVVSTKGDQTKRAMLVSRLLDLRSLVVEASAMCSRSVLLELVTENAENLGNLKAVEMTLNAGSTVVGSVSPTHKLVAEYMQGIAGQVDVLEKVSTLKSLRDFEFKLDGCKTYNDKPSQLG